MMRITAGGILCLTAMTVVALPLAAQTAGTGTSTSTTTNSGVTYGSGWNAGVQSGVQGNVQASPQMGAPLNILPGNTGRVVIRQAQTQPDAPPPGENPDDNRAALPVSGGQATMSQGSAVQSSSGNVVQGSGSEGSSIQVGGGGVTGVGGGSVTGVGPGNAGLAGNASLPEMQIQRRPGENAGTAQ